MGTKTCSLCGNIHLKPIVTVHWSIKKCLSCGLVQASPLPSQKQVEAFYQGDLTKNYQPYLSQLTIHHQYFQKRIREINQKIPQGRLLDIGCALGPLLEVAKKAGYQTLGIDSSQYAVNYCQRLGLNAQRIDWSNIKGENNFDIITCFDTIEHELRPLSMVKKTHSLLKAGGLAVFTTPNHNNLAQALMGRFWPGYRHPEHLYFFTPVTLKLLFEKAGFNKIKILKDETRPFPISYLTKRMADYLPLPGVKDFFILLSKLFQKSPLSLPFSLWDNIMIMAEK